MAKMENYEHGCIHMYGCVATASTVFRVITTATKFLNKQKNRVLRVFRGQELCERRDGRPELPIPNSPYSLCGCKSALKKKSILFRAKEPCESRGGRPGLHVANSLYGLCGPKAAAKKKYIYI